MSMTTEIKLIQNPIIQHKLREVGAEVQRRIAELHLENQVATVETVQALKSLRAELNKEFDAFEAQRKAIKTGVLNPYNEFEDTYKVEVSERYKKAVETLKTKIATVENAIKEEKKKNVTDYFAELCLSEDISFLKFEDVGLEINLSTTEKAYREKCDAFVSKVKDDLAMIETSEYKAEVMVEYKKTLNASKAMTEVSARKQAEKDEEERRWLAEVERRKGVLKAMGFSFVDVASVYEYKEGIHISHTAVTTMTKEEFNKRLFELENAIREAQTIPFEEVQTPKEKPQEKPQEKEQPRVLPAPEVKEELVIAQFEVEGTMAQLKALGVYMRTNNVKYKNI